MQVPSDTVLHAYGFAWPHLPPDSRRAVRATCLGGRLLHDSLTTQLQLHLGPQLPYREVPDGPFPPQPPTPAELRACVLGMLRRGARLGCLGLSASKCFGDRLPVERDRQLLAVLEASSSSGCTIRSLHLAGVIPHSATLSAAMAAALPHLDRIKLQYISAVRYGPEEDDNVFDYLPYAEDEPEVQGAYGRAVAALLTHVGPRLRALEAMGSAHFWPPECFAALQQCTAVTSLTLEAGRLTLRSDQDLRLNSVAAEARVLSSVRQLTSLQSLHLTTNMGADDCDYASVAQYAFSLTNLSTLTALTSLDLQLTSHYMPIADRWSRWNVYEDEDECRAWEALRVLEYNALLLALCNMPRLQHLGCRNLWMQPPELAPLSALTSLALGGLMPPSPPLPPLPRPPLPTDSMAAWALPPQLQELHLVDGASPSILRLLQLPPSLKRIRAPVLCFGMYDGTAACRVLPGAVEAVGPAVRLLARYAGNVGPWFRVGADCGPRSMEPREEGPRSHTEWLSELSWLPPAVTKLELRNVRLRVGDVACLASTLPNLEELILKRTRVPMPALFALTRLQQLTRLDLDISHTSHTTEELVSLLSLLYRKMSALKTLTILVAVGGLEEGKDACFDALTEQLVAWGVAGQDKVLTIAMKNM